MPAITRPALTYARELGVRDGSSPAGSFGPDISKQIRKLRVPWAQQYEAVKRFCGYSLIERNEDDEPVRIRRLTHLAFPGAPFLRAVEVPRISHYKALKGTKQNPGDGTTSIRYQSSDLEITYEHVGYPCLEDDQLTDPAYEWERYTTISEVKPSADFLMMPGGTLTYIREADSGTTNNNPPHNRPIPFNVGKVIPVLEFEVKWHLVPGDIFTLGGSTPWSRRIFGAPATAGDPMADPPTEDVPAIRPYIGCVNDSDFLGFPPGQALLSAVNMKVRKLPGVGLAWDITFVVSVKPTGWNFAYYFDTTRPATRSGFYFVSNDLTWYTPGDDALPDDTAVYDERDLRLIFSVA